MSLLFLTLFIHSSQIELRSSEQEKISFHPNSTPFKDLRSASVNDIPSYTRLHFFDSSSEEDHPHDWGTNNEQQFEQMMQSLKSVCTLFLSSIFFFQL